MTFWHQVCYWGTRQDEIEAAWPCDGRERPEEASLFRAIDIDADPDRVFRWLCQLKEAPYSYDWLDNGGRQSPRKLTEGVEDLAIGQRVMSIFELVDFETDRFMTLITRRTSRLLGTVLVTYQTLPRPVSPGRSQGQLEARPQGGGTRLIARLRIIYPSGLVGWLARIALPLGDFIMMRKQLLTLKALAESEGASRSRTSE